MKSRWNTWLLLGMVIPLVLHFWPFAWWGSTTLVCLRIVPALCAQTLMCRIGKRTVIKVIPLLITGALALWIGYLYFILSRPLSAAAFWMLFWEYFSPFVSCVLVCGIVALREKIQ